MSVIGLSDLHCWVINFFLTLYPINGIQKSSRSNVYLCSVLSAVWKILSYYCPCVDMVGIYHDPSEPLFSCMYLFCSINIYGQGMCLNNFLLRTCFILVREQSSLMESSKGKCVSHRRQRNIQYFWQEQKMKKKNQWRYIGDISDMNVNTVFQFGDNSCVNILYWNLFWLRVLEKREGEREWQRERKCLCVAKNERESI